MDEGLASCSARATPPGRAPPGLPADRTRYPFIFLHNIGNASRWDALDMRRHPLQSRQWKKGNSNSCTTLGEPK